MGSRYAPRSPTTYSGSWCAPATRTRASTATGGIAPPQPSKRVPRRSSPSAISAPHRTPAAHDPGAAKGGPARGEPVGDRGAREHVRDERLAREPAAAPPAPDGSHPAQGRRLVVVARRVRPALQGFGQVPAPPPSL